jgi:hypothetical protein
LVNETEISCSDIEGDEQGWQPMANALRASDVDRALGIQPDLVNGNWSTIPAMIDQARYAGVDTLRIAAPTTNNPYGQFDTLAEAGFKLEFVADTRVSPQDNVAAIADFIIKHPGSVAFVEGPNEPNNFNVNYAGMSGIPAAVAWQANFYAAMNANPVTAGIFVAGMSSWPAVAAASDGNNMHIYPNHGGQPGASLAEGLGVQNAVDPGKGFVITEIGWYTAPGVIDPNPFVDGVDETTQAKLVLNAYMDGIQQGAKAVTLYSLRDWIYTNTGAHYGIFHSDGTPKTAATSLHNLQNILSDTGADASSFTVKPLDYTLEVLAVWREPDVWNEVAGQAITPAGVAINLHLPGNANAAIYDPMVGAAALQTAASVTNLQMSVTDHPIFVTLSAMSDAHLGTAHALSGVPAAQISVGQSDFGGSTYQTYRSILAWGKGLGATLKPAEWDAGYATKLAFDNFVKTTVNLAKFGTSDFDIMLVSAKRGSVSLGNGDDHVTWVAHSEGPSTTVTSNTMTINTGSGNDVVKITAAGLSSLADPDKSSNGRLYNPGYDGKYSIANVTFGNGHDIVTVEGKTTLVLHAGIGQATAKGGTGNDLFYAGPGSGNFTGGDGADTFIFTKSNGHVTIQDFASGIDHLQFLSSAKANMHTTVAIELGVTGLLVTYEFGGDSVFLANVSKLGATDLIFV